MDEKAGLALAVLRKVYYGFPETREFIIGNKAKGRISKRVFQESKAR